MDLGEMSQLLYDYTSGYPFLVLRLCKLIDEKISGKAATRTRNLERTDMIVDYQGEQFIIKIKIWHGNAYKERDEVQLRDYLDYYHLDKGYMLSFNFNKKKEVNRI